MTISICTNRYIAEDGWVWHPIGEVVTWNLQRWLQSNVWESEDGSSRRILCGRDYFWNSSMCWVSSNLLAVWGFGDDDECMVPAARIFDVNTGKEVTWFPGPKGKFVFDTYLFSFSEKDSLSIWDVETGEQLLQDQSLTPLQYHPQTKQFLSILPNGLVKLSKLTVQR